MSTLKSQPMPGAPGAPQSEPEALRNLMVNYIPTTIDEMQMRQLFEMYGPIESVKIVCDRETRQSKGYGFVKYRFAFSAMHAIQYLNGYPLMNKRLKVAYANAAEAQKASQTGGTEASPYAAQAQAAMMYNPMAMQGMDPAQAYMQQMAAMQMMQQQQQMMMQQMQHANTNQGHGQPQGQGRGAGH